MEQKLIYVCTEDIVYGKRLLQYITGRSEPYIEFGLLTSFEKWESIKKNKNVIGLFIDDNSGMGREPPDFKGKTIILTASGKHSKPNSIFKYQKAESIYQEIIKKFQIADIRSAQSIETKEVIIIFAPKRGNGGLSFLTHEINANPHNKNSIYMNLSSLPFALSGIPFRPENTSGLSELILALEEESFHERVKECVCSYAGVDMIPPVRHYKDLLDIKINDLQLLISRLQQECGYQTCYIECCELYEFTLPLFASADRIHMIHFTKEEGYELMKHYLKTEGIDSLEERCLWTNHDLPGEDKNGGQSKEALEGEGMISYEYGEA